MRKTIENFIIAVKEDLKLADTLKAAREQILKSISDKTYFSESLVAYFTGVGDKAYVISPKDPSQVALLKKILNSFADAEHALRELEQLDIDPEHGGRLFNAANWVGLGGPAKTLEILAGAGAIYYKKIHSVYAALQLLNQANADVHNIVGPHLQALMPSLALARSRLLVLTPSFPAETAGEVFAELVNELPKQAQVAEHDKQATSQWLLSLPEYFTHLHKMVAKSTFSQPNQAHLSAAEYQAAMLGRAQETKAYFEALVASQSGDLSSSGSYFKLMAALALHSAELLQSVPASPQAYAELIKKLEYLRLNYLPQVLAEFEKIEEGMSLKTGLLTTAALAQMNSYYQQLASRVYESAQRAGLAGQVASADLLVMEDEGFRAARRRHQDARLVAVRLESANGETKAAAERFFARLNSYNIADQHVYKRSLANLSQEEKAALMADYKQFQKHFAALNPEVDQLLVETLTKATGNGFWSRLWNSDYKQLLGTNHFSTVVECRTRVLESIDQSMAQAEFKAGLISASIKQAQTKPLSEKTALQQSSELLLLSVPREGGSLEDCQQQAAEHMHEVLRLERAKAAVQELLAALAGLNAQTALALLDENLKERIRRIYQELQVPLSTMANSASLHSRIVASLSSKTQGQPPLLLAELRTWAPKIEAQCASLLTQTQERVQAALRFEAEARAKQPLVVQAAELERRGLFAMLHDLKLSEKLDDFINERAQSYLKEHLSPVVWEELRVGFNALPYTMLHKDSPQVVLYKQVLNSIYHVQQGLRELESLDRNAPNDLVGRTRYVYGTMTSLITALNNSRPYLSAAANNPGLQALLQESQALLAPVSNLPFFKLSLVNPGAGVSEKAKTAKECWEEQQALLRRARSVTPVAAVAPQPALQRPAERSYVRLVAEALYKLPQALAEHNSGQPAADSQVQEEQINALVERFSALSFNQESIEGILALTSKLQKQLNLIGSGSRELVMANLKEIRSELGFIMVSAAGKLEFELGLKPGTYSSMVSEHFDRFYESLISSLPLAKDQDGLSLLVDVEQSKKLLAKETAQLAQARTELALVGEPKLTAALDKFVELVAHDDWDKPAQAAFLQAYAHLQPYLSQINPRYDLSYFLRDLEQPEDFARAATAICNEQRSLDDLLLGLEKGKRSKVALAEERVTHYQARLTHQVEVLGPKRIEAFKQKVYDNYVGANVESLLAERLGAEQAALFASYAKPAFLGMKAEILAKLGIKDEIEEAIASAVNARLPQLMKDYTEPFKAMIFSHYLEQKLKKNLGEDLGLYQELFFKQIEPFFLRAKEGMLANLSLDQDFSMKLDSQLGDVLVGAVATMAQLRKDLVDLNQFGVQLEARIRHLATQEPSSERQEMMQELSSLLATLEPAQINIEEPSKNLKQAKIELSLIVYNNQLNSIKRQFSEQLGTYTDLFLRKVNHVYESNKSLIVQKAIKEGDLDGLIARELQVLTAGIEVNNQVLKAAFGELNKFAQQLKRSLSEEESLAPNPCRIKKIELMRKLEAFIHEEVDVPLMDSNWVNNKHKKAQEDLAHIQEYDALIQINDLVNTVLNSISQEDSALPIKTERLKAVKELQQILFNEDLAIVQRVTQVMDKLRETSEAQLLQNAQHQVVKEAFKNYFYSAQLRKEKDKLESSLGVFKERFMASVEADLAPQQEAIKEEMSVGMSQAQIEALFAQHLPAIFATHQELNRLCQTLNQTLITIDNLISLEVGKQNALTEVDLKANPCHQELLERLTAARDGLRELAFTAAPVDSLVQKRNELEALTKEFARQDQLVELHNLLTTLRNCIQDSPPSAVKEQKLLALNTLQVTLTARDKTPFERLQALEQVNRFEQKTLTKSADSFFMRLYKSFVAFLNKCLGKEPSQEVTMANKYNDNLRLFKGRVEQLKDESAELRNDEEPDSPGMSSN